MKKGKNTIYFINILLLFWIRTATMFCEEETDLMVLSRDGFDAIMKNALGIYILIKQWKTKNI